MVLQRIFLQNDEIKKGTPYHYSIWFLAEVKNENEVSNKLSCNLDLQISAWCSGFLHEENNVFIHHTALNNGTISNTKMKNR